MSIDLAWDALIHQTSLSSTLVDLINRRLLTVQRPSFMGPVTITSFEFGTASPDIELIDIRDVYPDFLEDDGEEEHVMKTEDDLDNFQWAPREGLKLPEKAHRPPLNGQNSMPNLSNNAQSSMDFWKDRIKPSTRDNSHRLFMSSLSATDSAASTIQSTPKTSLNEVPNQSSSSDETESNNPPLTNERPNIQLHFRVTYESNMRLILTTSLIVNYPSPAFMTLPMKISVTGFIFTGEVVVAYQSLGQRLHLCIVDDLDPYGPKSSQASTYPDHALNDSGIPTSQKPLSAGIRLLPSIFIESEIGQSDKHVLKNGTRVERFIQDVIRKTLEEELLFPNYHTILLED